MTRLAGLFDVEQLLADQVDAGLMLASFPNTSPSPQDELKAYAPGDTVLTFEERGDDAGPTRVLEPVRYLLGERIGGGTQAEVFRSLFKGSTPCAVKILRREVIGSPVAVRRLLREAAVLARVVHPNVVRVLDHGKMRDGRTFIVTELAEGPTLERILEAEAPLELSRARALLAQLADALAAAHAIGIVHRDLKPANIVVTRIENREQLKLLDFGVALDDDREVTRLTRCQQIVGTPRYASPEQIFGHSVDPRSDLYSLGVIGFQMLTGRFPVPSKSLSELVDGLARPLALPPELGALGGLIGDLLMVDITLRPRSATEVARSLATTTQSSVRFRPARSLLGPVLIVAAGSVGGLIFGFELVRQRQANVLVPPPIPQAEIEPDVEVKTTPSVDPAGEEPPKTERPPDLAREPPAPPSKRTALEARRRPIKSRTTVPPPSGSAAAPPVAPQKDKGNDRASLGRRLEVALADLKARAPGLDLTEARALETRYFRLKQRWHGAADADLPALEADLGRFEADLRAR